MKKILNIEAITLFSLFAFTFLCAFSINGCMREEPSFNVIIPESLEIPEPAELYDLNYPVTEYDLDNLACKVPPARPHRQSRPFAWNREVCGCCGYMPWTDSWCELHRNEGDLMSVKYPNGTSNITAEHLAKTIEDVSELWKMRHPNRLPSPYASTD
jgi:hypothetical protein